MPAEGADPAALADWRVQHEAWRTSHAQWKAGQVEAERAARARAALENKQMARELAAQADAARAARRVSRPRASAAFGFTVIGVALIAGAVAALWALGGTGTAGFAIPIALAVATIALAIGMVVAALRRRRSGALAFFTMLATVSMLVGVAAASIMPQGALVPPGYGISVGHSQRLVQPFGDAYVYAYPTGGTATPVVELTQGTGDTWLTVDENAVVTLDASEAGPIEVVMVAPDGSVTRPQIGSADRVLTLSSETGVSDRVEGRADVRLVLDQRSGRVHIEIREGE